MGSGGCKLAPGERRNRLQCAQVHWLKKMKMVGKMKKTKMEEEAAPLEAMVLFGSWVLNWTGIFFSSSGICLELETGGYGPAAEPSSRSLSALCLLLER